MSAAEQAMAGAPIEHPEDVEWARARLRAGDTYWLEPDTARADPAVYQWLTFRLMPRRIAPALDKADAVIWYGRRPRRPPAGFTRPETLGTVTVAHRVGSS